ncbi:peptidase C45 acyl-coenzyme A:6-aminopenicillanic acid acyl-transferas-like protein [Rhizodiscina lignyota]|uniref:Peptidase C45 acyl-coenzyme A:6-aminopenicillanic acid acyl-transferas-like protein n=1 Tax=Rhizodiscina lignyota TaxID=1504668 RepID=A0A9P4I522_9PEZI|nr:peptidase C45 acyl-coenzyme A:6-aminopenicillanic acid acyl-transferas-like protein [Rhizodiscina lignyota]
MLSVDCTGTPYEIGYKHGSAAKVEVERCIDFYAKLFVKNSKQSWPQVQETARSFGETIKSQWPQYYEEIQGIAEGAERDILDIVALNVRTEIAFGQFSDGCTSVSWHGEKRAWLGQNWDWMPEQKKNLIILRVKSNDGRPSFAMITEAGIIGKIGFNERGVGVCLNAIRARGCDASRLPVHLGLRMALESQSAKEATDKMEAIGMASSAHILIADENEGIGFEFTATTFARLPMDLNDCVIHSNHLLAPHPDVYEPGWLKDSPLRVATMGELTQKLKTKVEEPSWEEFSKLFEDETHYPAAICRKYEGESGSESLFNIVMELKSKKGVVKLGRPIHPEETVVLECM